MAQLQRRTASQLTVWRSLPSIPIACIDDDVSDDDGFRRSHDDDGFRRSHGGSWSSPLRHLSTGTSAPVTRSIHLATKLINLSVDNPFDVF